MAGCIGGFFGGSDGKNLPAMQETRVCFLLKKLPEKGMATHASILAWRVPWTAEPAVGVCVAAVPGVTKSWP